MTNENDERGCGWKLPVFSVAMQPITNPPAEKWDHGQDHGSSERRKPPEKSQARPHPETGAGFQIRCDQDDQHQKQGDQAVRPHRVGREVDRIREKCPNPRRGNRRSKTEAVASQEKNWNAGDSRNQAIETQYHERRGLGISPKQCENVAHQIRKHRREYRRGTSLDPKRIAESMTMGNGVGNLSRFEAELPMIAALH